MNDVAKVPVKPKKGWFTINISLGNDKEAVKQFIGADGKDFLIQRGKDVSVPPEVLSVLDDAVMIVDEQDPTDENKTVQVPRKRFPYTIIQAH